MNRDGFLFVYSLTDDQTLEELRSIHEQVLNVHPNKNVPILVVANKLDLAAADRAVSIEEGEALADEIGAVGFLEVSAKQNVKVKEAFEELLKKIVSDAPDAGSGEGSGGVFGGGNVDGDDDSPDGKSAIDQYSKPKKKRQTKIFNPITTKKKFACNIL